MSSLVGYEPLVNSTLTYFLDKTEERFIKTGTSCNFSQWLQYFAFDVIGELTWSKRLGFVEGNKDIDNIITFLGKFFDYVAPVSCSCTRFCIYCLLTLSRLAKSPFSMSYYGKTHFSSLLSVSAWISVCTR